MKEKFIKFKTYNEALDLHNLGNMWAWLGVLLIVVLLDKSFFGHIYYTTVGTFFVVAFACLKGWSNMILKRKPGKNCWEFYYERGII